MNSEPISHVIELMPILRPVRIETRHMGRLTGFWRWLTAKRTWCVAQDWVFELPLGGPRCVIPAGFIFDGASIPRIFWWFLSPTGLLLIPGLIHDFAYRYDLLLRRGEDNSLITVHIGYGKDHWYRLFRVLTQKINNVFLLHWIVWLAVSLGGAIAWKNNRKRNEKPYWREHG